VGVDGAGILLMSGALPRGSVATSDSVAAALEDVQYTVGEGPCIDAHVGGRPVLEPDLAHPALPRWPAFTPGALAAGATAVFGFPLRVGGVRLGSLNLYRSGAGALTDEGHADALVAADVVTEVLLALQGQSPDDMLSADLEAHADFRFVVAQATGMVSSQLDVPVTQALLRLRAYAFAHDRPINDVAQDVVDRRLIFEPDLEGRA
jgi:hypothetical protein